MSLGQVGFLDVQRTKIVVSVLFYIMCIMLVIILRMFLIADDILIYEHLVSKFFHAPLWFDPCVYPYATSVFGRQHAKNLTEAFHFSLSPFFSERS